MLTYRAAGIVDNLKYYFSEHIVNSLTYASSLIENIVRMAHHVAVIHLETERNIYEICKNHEELVQKILTNIDPIVYQTVIRSFSRLNFVEVNSFVLYLNTFTIRFNV